MEGESELEAFLGVPPDKVFFIMLLRQLIIDYLVSMTSDLSQQIKHFISDISPMNLLLSRVLDQVLEVVAFAFFFLRFLGVTF